jgi:hypothetical protein
VELATRWEVEAELEALWSSAAQVRDLVLGRVDGSSSLTMCMPTVAELFGNRINAAAANGSVGDPVLRWLPPCRISWSRPIWRCLGPDAAWY